MDLSEKEINDILLEIERRGTIETAKELMVVIHATIAIHGDMPIRLSIPYRNGIGLHYETIKNLSVHEEIFDIFTSTPKHDDIEKPSHGWVKDGY